MYLYFDGPYTEHAYKMLMRRYPIEKYILYKNRLFYRITTR